MDLKNNMQDLVMKDSKLKLKYNILNKIGEGSFGQIYKAINRKTQSQVALKIEFNSDDRTKSNLILEVNILNRLKGVAGVPKIFSAGKWQHGVFMEMELLGSSLQDESSKEFSLPQINQITIEILHILERIHKKGVIHQDLKPQNLLRNEKGNIVLIDFGLSTIKKDCSPLLNVRELKKKGFIGTPRYASIAAHKGQTQSPKDDIQSLLYVMGFLFLKKCPWLQMKGPTSERMEKIQKFKALLSEGWMEECGSSFSKAYHMIQELSAKDEVDYQALIQFFQQNRLTGVFQKKILNQRRRMSESCSSFLSQLRALDLNLNQLKKSKEKRKQNSIELSNTESSNRNFSETGQDNFKQILQMLTGKLLDINLENEQNFQEQELEAPVINNPKKYELTCSNNPFELKTKPT